MGNLVRVSLSIEEELLDSLEKMVSEKGYENRSEFFRDMIRENMTRGKWERGGEVLGTLTVVYNHHRHGLTEKLVELQHHCGENVLASTHVHLSHEICAEMIMLKGKAEGIIKLGNEIKRLCGVLSAELAMSTTGDDIH